LGFLDTAANRQQVGNNCFDRAYDSEQARFNNATDLVGYVYFAVEHNSANLAGHISTSMVERFGSIDEKTTATCTPTAERSRTRPTNSATAASHDAKQYESHASAWIPAATDKHGSCYDEPAEFATWYDGTTGTEPAERPRHH
jgi:hypothetical protein